MGKLIGYTFAAARIDLLKDTIEMMKGKAIKAYQREPISHSLFTKQLTSR